MSKNEVLDNLDYARKVAEQGIDAPLVGGRFGLLWGVLLTITFAGHWAILTGTVGLPLPTLGWLWLGFAVAGSAGTFLLDRTVRNKPGLSSFGNRADSVIWMFFGATMFACFLGLALKLAAGGGSYPLFDFMVAIGFAGQGMAYGALSQLTTQRWLLAPAIGAYLLAIVSFYLYGTAALYLAAAAGVIVTVVIPSAVNYSREPADV